MRVRPVGVLLLLAMLVVAVSRASHAQPAAPASAAQPAAGSAGAAVPPSDASPPPPARRPGRRPMPVYDGRPAPAPGAADIARTIGRVVLFPAYALVQWGLRAPVGYVVRTLEHSRTARQVFRYVFLGPPAPTLSIYPIAFYDFGFRPSVGLRMAWVNGFATPGSALNLKLATGGTDWLRAETTVKLMLPAGFRTLAEFGFRRRPDLIFHGIGSRTPEDALARYTLSRTNLMVGVGWRGLTTYGALSTVGATPSTFSDDPSIDEQVARGRITSLPAGYRDLMLIERLGARLALDTRSGARSTSVRGESGARLDATLERVHEDDHGSWTRFEGEVGAGLVLDPVGEYHLHARLRLELVDAPDLSRVPFMELASIGGSRELRGFANGRGRDASALSMMIDYEWPVAAWLEATLYLGAGNVFGPNLSGIHAGSLRGMVGTGLSIVGLSPERHVELWTAAGTDPLDEGLRFSSFRLVLGFTHDY